MASLPLSSEIEGAAGGADSDSLNSEMDFALVKNQTETSDSASINDASDIKMDTFFQNSRKDLMYELRQIQHGEKPVTGKEHREQIDNFLSKRLRVQSQNEGKENVPANLDEVEEHRPEAIVVEVEGLYASRPVSSLLQGTAFRRHLDDILRRSFSVLTPRNNAQQSASSDRSFRRPTPPQAPPIPEHPQQLPERSQSPSPNNQSAHVNAQPQSASDQPDIQDEDHYPPPRPAFFEQLRPSREEALRIQRETIIDEISELVHSGLVSSSLDGEFRGTLELLVEERLGHVGNGERVLNHIRSLPRNPLHQRNDFSHLGLHNENDSDNISVTSISASAVPYTQTNIHLRRELTSLKSEFEEMKNMLKMNFELQLDIQRAIRQEVAAAVSTATSEKAEASGAERRYKPVNDAECIICLENKVNSVLYQCGHMCVCYCCGKHLIHQGAKCPICRAPIKDIIQAFSCNGNAK